MRTKDSAWTATSTSLALVHRSTPANHAIVSASAHLNSRVDCVLDPEVPRRRFRKGIPKIDRLQQGARIL